MVYISALLGPPFVLGRITRRLHDQREELGRQAAELRRQQALIKDQAVREERDRIARELHDVIAHSISAMVVQASAAQDLLRTDPTRAATALDAVTSTGRQALDQYRVGSCTPSAIEKTNWAWPRRRGSPVWTT